MDVALEMGVHVELAVVLQRVDEKFVNHVDLDILFGDDETVQGLLQQVVSKHFVSHDLELKVIIFFRFFLLLLLPTHNSASLRRLIGRLFSWCIAWRRALGCLSVRRRLIIFRFRVSLATIFDFREHYRVFSVAFRL